VTTLYWFSGTGNSLAVARALAQRLDDATLVPIASLPANGTIVPTSKRIGIVCPVYFYSLPLLVKEFLDRLDPSHADYTFLVLTMGGLPGMAAHHARRRFRRAGRRLDAAFSVGMPGNYIAMYNARGRESAQRMAARAEAATQRIASAVAAQRARRSIGRLALLPFSALIYAAIGRRFAADCRGRDERFTVTDACTSCGTCVRVCPVNNIGIVDGRPIWRHRCEQCFACVHFCPTEAIQIPGTRSAARRRYHHPGVTVEEIEAQCTMD